MSASRVIYWTDVAHFFRKSREKVFLATLLSSLLTLLLLFWRLEPHFLAEATFKEAKSTPEEGAGLESLLRSLKSAPQELSTAALMQSKHLLGRLATQEGLQIVPCEKKRGKQLLRAQFRLEEKENPFRFCSVDYQGIRSTPFSIQPLTETTFLVTSQKKKVEGRLGAPVQLRGLRFTLTEMPFSKKKIPFVATSKRDAIAKLKKRLKIKRSRIDSQLIQLSCKAPSRREALSNLDRLMLLVQEHLQGEHKELAEGQIAYLERRRAELSSDFERALAEHSSYLEKGGDLSFNYELALLSEPKETYLAKRHDLDLERDRLSCSFLEAKAHHLEDQITLLPEGGQELGEFEGIDLEMAHTLTTKYSQERDQLFSEKRELFAAKTRLDDPQFELATLSCLLPDGTSQTLLAQAKECTLALGHPRDYSSKELERLRQNLHHKKTLLLQQIEKRSEQIEERVDHVELKLAALKTTTLQLLEKERSTVEKKLTEIGAEMGNLPEKWRLETLLKQRREEVLKILEGLTHLLETKAIHHQLFHIESKPIDPPDAPLVMESPHLLLYTCLGGGLGGLLFFCALFLQGVHRGLPLSEPYLRDLGYKILGKISDPTPLFHRLDWELGEKKKILLVHSEEGLVRYLEEGGHLLLPSTKMGEAEKILLLIDREETEDLTPFDKERTLCILR